MVQYKCENTYKHRFRQKGFISMVDNAHSLRNVLQSGRIALLEYVVHKLIQRQT